MVRNSALLVAAEEWRLWLRSRVVRSAALLFLTLLFATSVATAVSVLDAQHERAHQQIAAEDTFYDQPARHPHRMVHYGHYVYRTPSPLSVFDPGLDTLTGQTLFLEGHRQNSATFADSSASTDLGPFAKLTPAFAYQLFVPLIIILLGHNAVVRERSASTLTLLLSQNVSASSLLAGKLLSLLCAAFALLFPIALMGAVALFNGEALSIVIALLLAYLIYLAIWSLLTLTVSLVSSHQRHALIALVALWLGMSLVLPSLAVSNVGQRASGVGYIKTNLLMTAELRELGDSHNANDPAFQRLRQQLLDDNGVESIEDLPVNFRGVVSQYGERKQTELLNRFAEARMQNEVRQSQLLLDYGWISPFLSIMEASRALAGSDLVNHHAFLRDAEAVRYEFVQGLNRMHAEKLAYADDMKRSSDPEAEQRTRIAAENWRVLERFEFSPMAAEDRIRNAWSAIYPLTLWLFGLLVLLAALRTKVRP